MSYTKQTFVSGDTITSAWGNKVEQGIFDATTTADAALPKAGGVMTGNPTVSSAAPAYKLQDTDAPLNKKIWRIEPDAGNLYISRYDDDDVSNGAYALLLQNGFQVLTKNNTLDDGAGAMIIPNNQGLNSKDTLGNLRTLAYLATDNNYYFAHGNMRYNIVNGALETFTGGAWQAVGRVLQTQSPIDSGQVASATDVTVANITGAGQLEYLFTAPQSGTFPGSLTVIVDGVTLLSAYQIPNSNYFSQIVAVTMLTMSTAGGAAPDPLIRFKSSLVIKIRSNTGNTGTWNQVKLGYSLYA